MSLLKFWQKQAKKTAGAASPFKKNRLKTKLQILTILVIFGGGWYSYEVYIARPAMAFEGIPKHQDWKMELTTRVIRNEAFMVGYSEIFGNPLWVKYQVLPKPDNIQRLPRPDRFVHDWRSLRCWLHFPCVNHDDYTGTGYDRGHMAPNHVIATRYGQNAQHQTFLMTNITPQRPNLNRRAWQRLEEIAANHFSDNLGAFWVVTGPIFDEKPQFLPGYKMIAIPKAFYKIFIREAEDPNEPPKVLAFIMPQNLNGNEDLSDFLVSVRDIEQQTGLDFFHKLDDAVEAYVETLIDPQSWQFNQRIANQRARY
ncbi:DNA/RNA non-specific endonuclease [Thiomicrospira microaerophila]|uniref:DNA/RNA non-specific endonuclease n=1 Tax=Thiomicrospira microaerophila TaxID=406020 RepID=UPI0020109A7E|nr:DNA/RNA non-specific endonuclease [Thiomicrospira microaerophila]